MWPAVGINDSGNITGNYRDATGTHGYFLNYVGGVFTPIDYPSTPFTFTDGINNIGNIVGSYQAAGIRHGYFLDAVGGNYTPFDFPGAIDTPHLGINDAGSIVGIYGDTSGIFHGFLSTKNVFSGFFSPVDNLPIVNNAKAGQTIPIIW